MNSKREIEKEEKYRRYFKDFENNMQKRMNQHLQYVTTTEVAKQKKLDEIEHVNQEKYKQWVEQKEKFEKDIRTQGLRDMQDTNRIKMEEHMKSFNN